MARLTGLPSRVALLALALLLPHLVNSQAMLGGVGDVDDSCAGTVADEVYYIGCYDTDVSLEWWPEPWSPTSPDDTYPDFWPYSKINNTVHPQSCMTACRGYGFKYSAFFTSLCSCGNVVEPSIGSLTKVGDDFCDYDCGGAHHLFCGGSNATAIYMDSTFADDTAVSDAAVQGAAYQYIGCFNEANLVHNDTAAKTVLAEAELGSHQACREFCAARHYPYMTAEVV